MTDLEPERADDPALSQGPTLSRRELSQIAAARFARRTAAFALILVVLATWLWGHFALRYSNLGSESFRAFGAWTYTLGSLALFLFLANLWKATAWFLGVSLVLLLWWFFIPASEDREWVGDLRRQARAEIEGDFVTLRNIRDFGWQNGWDEYLPRYYDETFDLRTIEEVDLAMCYWDEVRVIAHTILSFGFSDGKRVAFSIEVRREVGESYSPFQGLFKQFELHYVVASEADVLRVRTNHRGEEVYLYPTRATPEQARALFSSYVVRVNELADKPEFYHTIFNNCTTNILHHINQVMPEPVPMSGKVLFNGYSDLLAYELGWIDDSIPYRDLREQHYISGRAKETSDGADFSASVREFPEPAQQPVPEKKF